MLAALTSLTLASTSSRNYLSNCSRLIGRGRNSRQIQKSLFCVDIRCLDNRPPLLNLGLLMRAERLWRLLLGREDLLRELGKSRTNPWIGQGIHDCGVELADNLLWRTLWGPKREPGRIVEPWQSRLVYRRNMCRSCHALLGHDSIDLDAASAHLRYRINSVFHQQTHRPAQQP